MPRGDGTGPTGMGPMTGRGAGYCAGYSVPGYMNFYGERYPGAGRAFGGGRGYRNWYYATGLSGQARYNMGYPAWGGVGEYPYYGTPPEADLEPEQEKEILKSHSEALQKQLDEIKARMNELSKEQKAK